MENSDSIVEQKERQLYR